jgi:hypothetical protein
MSIKKHTLSHDASVLTPEQMRLTQGGYILTCEERKHYNKQGELVDTEIKWKMVDDGCDELTEIIDVTGRKVGFEHKPKKISAAQAMELMGSMGM